MDLQPLGDRLIVEVLEEEETTTSGIVLPDTAKEKPQRGKVLAVGPGSRNDEGNIIPMEIAEGDEIIFSKYGGTEVKLGSDGAEVQRGCAALARARRQHPRRRGQGHPWPEGPVRRARQEVRRADHHQRRRHDRA